MSAVISECGGYRYVLRRSLGSTTRAYKPCLFIMLNPSTADATFDDPTIKRCIAFAKRENKTHLTVVNLFAYRATDPKVLLTVGDPHGPENAQFLAAELREHRNDLIICAWGSNKIAKKADFPRYYPKMMCLGMTADGSPRHPLYVKSDQPLITYRDSYFNFMEDDDI